MHTITQALLLDKHTGQIGQSCQVIVQLDTLLGKHIAQRITVGYTPATFNSAKVLTHPKAKAAFQ